MGAVNKYADENVFRCFDMCDRLENYKSYSELTDKRLFVSLAVLKNMAELQNVDEDELSKSFTEKFDDSKLSEEFVSEYKDKFKKEQKEEKSRISKNYKAVRRFFYDKKDGNEYGLYKKIYDELGIDLELKPKDSPEEKLDKLKLLKMICFAERIGVYESIKYDKHRFPDIIKGMVPIIRILKNPKIDIIDGYGYGTDFVDEFYIIYHNVRNLIKDADKIEATIESIHDKWDNLINTVKNEAIGYKSVSIGLDIIHNFIMEGKHNEIEKYVSLVRQDGNSYKKAGVMKQFFIKLATAKVRAELNGLIKLYTGEKSDTEKSNRLSKKFVEEYMCDSFYNEYMNIEEFWNISFNNIDAERKLKIWKLVLFNENPITETALITKKDNLKYRNRCLKLAMIWKMEKLKENSEMRVNEWCFSLGALIQMLNSKDEFETYDKSDFKPYRSFSAAVKALDNDEKRTKHSDAALRLYIKKRERQLFTCDELDQITDSFIKDIYILENQIMSYNNPDVILNINREVFLNTEIYSVSEVAKQYEYLLAVIKLGELIKNKKNMTEVAVCPIMCANMNVNLVFWGFYYRSIFYEEKIKNHYNIKAKQYMAKINTEVYDREKLMEWNRDIIWKNISSPYGYSDEIIERFADELCREDLTIDETMKYTHTFKDSDGFEFEVEIGFMVHKNPDLIWIQYCKFNEKNNN